MRVYTAVASLPESSAQACINEADEAVKAYLERYPQNLPAPSEVQRAKDVLDSLSKKK